MGAGYSRINVLTVIQTSQGLAEHLRSILGRSPRDGVVIGHDARHNSERFARHAAAVFIQRGFLVWWLEDLVHTPMVPFAIGKYKALAGVMITASHNPARDNGFKVYGSNGCQINTPEDQSIAASILNHLEPTYWRAETESPSIVSVSLAMRSSYKETLAEYLHVKSSLTFPPFVYTPMHGVGLPYMLDMLYYPDSGPLLTPQLLGRMVLVKEQASADPDFPTVKYPNPEETGALDLAKATADRQGIKLILANDPDADRFAAAEKVDGQWHQFTGDQVGILLAYFIFSQLDTAATADDVMLTSAVSSAMLSHMAMDEQFTVEETLTGFKWLGNRALELQGKGKRVHFAYEEALGYMFPQVVHDKDGIAAAGVWLKACAEWNSPWAKLQELYQRYGYFETMNTYWRSPDVATTTRTFARIQAACEMDHFANRRVSRWRDLGSGSDSGSSNGKAVLPSSSGTMMITCWLQDIHNSNETVRLTIRASGTEPKIKRKCRY